VSTDLRNPGGKLAAEASLEAAKALVDAGAEEQEQLELIAPLTADELEAAQERLGPNAGKVAVMREARRGRGRPPGVRNKRTDDFVRYISQFGQDPAITLMQIQSTPTEELVARSILLDPEKRRLSTGDAEALRIRCAEALMPYMHGKQPVRVDANIRGVIVQETIGDVRGVRGVTIDGEILGVLPIDDGEGPE
jgi:hypothetical protein